MGAGAPILGAMSERRSWVDARRARGVVGAGIASLVAAACGESAMPDGGLALDGAGDDGAVVDSAVAADAWAPDAATVDWPIATPDFATPEPGIRRDAFSVEGFDAPAHPTTSMDTPRELDRIHVIRYRAESTPDPRAVVLLLPGLFGGAGSYDPLARHLVRRSVAAGEPVEVWAIDRRSNALEDRLGLDVAEATENAEIARGYYYRGDTIGGQAFAGFRAASSLGYMSEWGLETHFGDLRRLIERVPASARQARVVLVGHSLGASMAETFAAWRFADGVRGAELVAGIVLVDGGQASAAGSEQVFREGGGTGFEMTPSIDVVRSDRPFLELPLLGVGVFVQAEILALAALADPDGVRERDTERGRLFSILMGVPAVQIPPMSNAAALGFGFDDAHNGLTFAAVKMGHAAGGPLESYTSAFGGELERPSDRTATYTWADAFDADPAELTSVASLGHSWVDGPTNFAEWYFPSRLVIDLQACGGLTMPIDGWGAAFGLRCADGALMDAPVLAIATALRTVADYEPSRLRAAAIGAGRPHAGVARTNDDAFRVLEATSMTHIDPLTADEGPGNPVPAAILSFVMSNVPAGTVSLPE